MSAIAIDEVVEEAVEPEVEARREVVHRKPRPKLTPDQQALAAEYMPLARSLARPIQQNWPKVQEEFESAASLALVEAAQIYDPNRGVKFATFARHRILGALRDIQRRMGESKYEREMPNARTYRYVPGAEEAGFLMLTSRETPVEEVVDAADEVEHWLRLLPRRQAQTCRALYIDGRTQNQLADQFGVAKSWVSSLHSEALHRLRAYTPVRVSALDHGFDINRN